MFYTSVGKILGSERDVEGQGWKSRRLLLAGEGLPFSVHETSAEAGMELRFCYQNHSETVYCVEGKGSLEDVASGEVHALEPGVLYSVAIKEDHILRFETDCKFLCIFEPPLTGAETAD